MALESSVPGPEGSGVLTSAQVDDLVLLLQEMRERAAA